MYGPGLPRAKTRLYNTALQYAADVTPKKELEKQKERKKDFAKCCSRGTSSVLFILPYTFLRPLSSVLFLFTFCFFLFTVRLLKKQEKQNKKIVRDAFFLVDVPLGISASFFFFVLFVLNK